MENEENISVNTKNYYISVIITQSVCAVLILLSLVCIKYCFKGTFSKIKDFYVNEICSKTNIQEVITEQVKSYEF